MGCWSGRSILIKQKSPALFNSLSPKPFLHANPGRWNPCLRLARCLAPSLGPGPIQSQRGRVRQRLLPSPKRQFARARGSSRQLRLRPDDKHNRVTCCWKLKSLQYNTGLMVMHSHPDAMQFHKTSYSWEKGNFVASVSIFQGVQYMHCLWLCAHHSYRSTETATWPRRWKINHLFLLQPCAMLLSQDFPQGLVWQQPDCQVIAKMFSLEATRLQTSMCTQQLNPLHTQGCTP